MLPPLLLVSGFGAFERVSSNPSAALARDLARRPPPGWRVAAVELPVSFARAPATWDAFRKSLRGRPALFLALGVSKEAPFRLERYGRPRLKLVARPDVDGALPRKFSRSGPTEETTLDLTRLVRALRSRSGPGVRVSRTAGGYVCERISHHILRRAREEGVAGLFLHVPPERFVPLARQARFVRRLLAELGRGDYGVSSMRGRAPSVRSAAAEKARTAARKAGRSRPM